VAIFLIGFVDDKSGSSNDFLRQTAAPPSHYLALATHDAQVWNDLLQLSGGALEDTKCSYHVVYYDFTVTGLPVLRSNIEPAIQIRFNDATVPSPLEYKSPFTAHKTLGTHKSPAGNQKAAFRVKKKKNDHHAKIIARSPFDRVDTWTYYHAIYLPSLCYSFPSGHLTVSQCEQLQSTVKSVVLPKYGFNRSTPNAVVFGPSEYACIELRTIAVEQGLSQLQALMVCLRSNGVPHQLANIAISWAQLLAGTATSIFEDEMASINPIFPWYHVFVSGIER
jgi:hypothetical protein